MKTPSPQAPDPALVQAQQDAQNAKNNQLQQSLSSDFLNMQRMFGARSAMAGAGITPPMQNAAGNFSMSG